MREIEPLQLAPAPEGIGMTLAGGGVPVEVLYVLVYQNRVSIRINHHKASRAGRAFVGL